jgi:hypothetical protein
MITGQMVYAPSYLSLNTFLLLLLIAFDKNAEKIVVCMSSLALGAWLVINMTLQTRTG